MDANVNLPLVVLGLFGWAVFVFVGIYIAAGQALGEQLLSVSVQRLMNAAEQTDTTPLTTDDRRILRLMVKMQRVGLRRVRWPQGLRVQNKGVRLGVLADQLSA